MEVVEARAARCDGINVGRLDDWVSVTTRPIGALLIRNEKQKVWTVSFVGSH